MPSKLLTSDGELLARFEERGREAPGEEGDPPFDADELAIILKCRKCEKAWEVTCYTGGELEGTTVAPYVGKAERTALMQHFKQAHEVKKRLRRVTL